MDVQNIFLRNLWSIACRKKSTEVILPNVRVSIGKSYSFNTIVNEFYFGSLLSSDVCKESFIYENITESDNRMKVMFLEVMVRNNLPHTVKCERNKPPYAEWYVRWYAGSSKCKSRRKMGYFSSYLIYIRTDIQIRNSDI